MRLRFQTILCLLLSNHVVSAKDVHLTVTERSGTDRKNAFVCTGVPFGRGELTGSMRLTTSLDTAVPAYVQPLALWPDGSVKWLRVQTRISIQKNETRRLVLKDVDAATEVAMPWSEESTATALKVSNGLLDVEFGKSGKEFIRSLSVNGNSVVKSDGEAQMIWAATATGPENTDNENWLREADKDVEPISATGVIESTHVEERTPFRIIVRVDGGIVTESGERKCSFLIRYHLYRNSPRIKTEWSVIWECEPETNFLRDCRLRLPASLEGASVRISTNGPSPSLGTAEDVSIVATKPDARIHQVRRISVRPVEVTYWHDGQENRSMIGTGSEDSGSLQVTAPNFRMAMAGERFAQRYPKQISVSDLEFTFHLWPSMTNQLLDFRQYEAGEDVGGLDEPDERILTGHPAGIAMTERIWMDFSGDLDGETLKAQAESSLMMKANPSYYRDTGVFGPLYVRNERLFPQYEGISDVAFAWLTRSPAEFKWFGLLNDGGSLTQYNWSRNQTSVSAPDTWNCLGRAGWSLDNSSESREILLAWLRSGDDSLLDYLTRYMRHFVDVGCVHAETAASMKINNSGLPGVGASRVPGATPWAQPTTQWVAGLPGRILWFLFTGEQQVLDSCLDSVTFLCLHNDVKPVDLEALVLGQELIAGLKKHDPLFTEKVTRRSKHRDQTNRPGREKYTKVEMDYFTTPSHLSSKVRDLVQSLDVNSLKEVTRSVVADGLRRYDDSLELNSPDRKVAQDLIRRIAEADLASTDLLSLNPGRAIAYVDAEEHQSRHVDWVKARFRAALDEDRFALVSLTDGLEGNALGKLSNKEIWRRLSLHAELSPHKTSHLFGLFLSRMPYLLKVIEADAEIEKLKAVKTDLRVVVTPLSNKVRIAWSGIVGWDVSGYELHRKKADGEFKKLKGFPGREDTVLFVDEDVTAGTPYQYVLMTVTRGGELVPYGVPHRATPLSWVKRINCGGPEVTTPDGRFWEADRARLSGSGIWTARTKIEKSDALEEIYKTERWANQTMTYKFEPEPGRYRIILHLAETNRSFSAPGKRVFEMLLDDDKFIDSIDVFKAAGRNTAHTISQSVELKKSAVTLTLKRVRGGGPAVKGIEILREAK